MVRACIRDISTATFFLKVVDNNVAQKIFEDYGVLPKRDGPSPKCRQCNNQMRPTTAKSKKLGWIWTYSMKAHKKGQVGCNGTSYPTAKTYFEVRFYSNFLTGLWPNVLESQTELPTDSLPSAFNVGEVGYSRDILVLEDLYEHYCQERQTISPKLLLQNHSLSFWSC